MKKPPLVIALILICSLFSLATVMVEPSRFILKIEPGQKQTGVITVINAGLIPTTLNAVLYDWQLNEEEKLQALVAGTRSDSLEKLIKFNPKNFTIQPGQAQIVRFTIEAPTDGIEHKGIVFFEENIALAGDGIGANVTSRIGTTIYAAPVDVKHSLLIKELRPFLDDEQINLLFSAHNNGTGHLRLRISYYLQNKQGKTLKEGSINELVILPDDEKIVVEPITKLSSGEYRLLMQVAFYDIEQRFEHTAEFSIP